MTAAGKVWVGMNKGDGVLKPEEFDRLGAETGLSGSIVHRMEENGG